MLRIRFRRIGLKGQPSYRIVVTDSRSPRDGRFLEVIGFHNPRTQPSTDQIDEARVLYWMSVGAQPSEALRYMLKRTGTLERFDRLRKGESLDALVAEAQAAEATRNVSSKTAYPSPEAGKSWQKARQAKEAGS